MSEKKNCASPTKSLTARHCFIVDLCCHIIQNANQRWSRGHKARGQGQGHKKNPRPRPRTAFRGQTLSRPRTGMLEAKDQGHKRKCSPKKKRSSQTFIRRSQKKKKKKKGLHKNFSSDLHKKTFSKKFFKRSAKF